jgi:hypothetical protein
MRTQPDALDNPPPGFSPKSLQRFTGVGFVMFIGGS